MTREARQQPVVFDVDVLIEAVVSGRDSFEFWPSPPPTSRHFAADCIGVVNDAVEFGLWLSPHILTNIERVLTAPADEGGFAWPGARVEEYLTVLIEIAEASGGGVLEPAVAVADCPDYEDNGIVELAVASQALLVVANVADLLTMSPWRGIPIISPREFATRVDALRRARRIR